MSNEVRIVRRVYPTCERFPKLPTPVSNSYFYGVVRMKTVARGVLTPSVKFALRSVGGRLLRDLGSLRRPRALEVRQALPLVGSGVVRNAGVPAR